MKTLLSTLLLCSITLAHISAQSEDDYVGSFFLATEFQYYGATVQEVTASESTLALGYYPTKKVVVYGGAGLTRDAYSYGLFNSDGYHLLGGLSYFLINQDDKSPITLSTSLGYQYTSLNSRDHNWLASGASLSHHIDFGSTSLLPLAGLAWNTASGNSREFVSTGNFLSYNVGLGFSFNGVGGILNFSKYPNMAWALSLSHLGRF